MKFNYKWGLFFYFLLHGTLSHILNDECANLQETLAKFGQCPSGEDGVPCAEVCEVKKFIKGALNCSKAKHCCYRNGSCYLKQPTTPFLKNFTSNSTSNITKVGKAFLKSLRKEDPDARTLVTNSIPIEEIQALFPGLSLCAKFPDSCFATFTSPEDLEPPLNIPYCQRIGCQENNPFLEFDPMQCLSIPGCAFDNELLLYRKNLGYSFLPGVPVCHLAIRNEAFQLLANAYVNQSGQPWNPLLTDCLIEHHRDQILGESKTCAMVGVIEELGYNAKKAGWKGISSRDCLLINGCWKNRHCVYPLRPKNIQVLSTNNLFASFDPNPYGNPSCLSFNDSLSGGDFLDAYHDCLSTGCSADVDQKTVLEYIHEVAKSYLPRFLQPQYWAMAMLGLVRADNWKEVADKLILDNANSPFNQVKNFPTNFSYGLPSKGGVSILPFTIALNLSGGSSLRDRFTSFGAFGQFGNNYPNQNNYARTLNVGSSTKNSVSNLNLGNIGSVINNKNMDSSELNDLKNSLSGVDTEPPIDIAPRSLIPCPFQQIQWPGFPSLSGSFEGCCERPICYIGRKSIRLAHSEIASYVTNWSSWGPCNVHCGIGAQTRRQHCIGKKCPKAVVEQNKQCLNPPCPVYLPWSPFGDCSVTCGIGIHTRTRICLGQGSCKGKASETIPCIKEACLKQKAKWSKCSSTCGFGTQARYLPCKDKCQTPQLETRECETFCGKVTYTQSPCNKINCTFTLIPHCTTEDGSPGHCPPKRMETITKKCKKSECQCRKNDIFCRYPGGRGR